jgi:hypothetical protein
MISFPSLSRLSRRRVRVVDPVWADVPSVGLDQPLGARCHPAGWPVVGWVHWDPDIPSFLRASLSPSWSCWETLLELELVLPGDVLIISVGPLDLDLLATSRSRALPSLGYDLHRNGECISRDRKTG